jgi:AraC-like DNA-binding protein
LINSYRVNEAKALLINEPQDTILDIAYAAGFNSKASFNRIFKKVTGMTPSEYRLKMRGSSVRDPNR